MNRKSLTLTFILTLLIALLLSTTAFAASNVWQIGTNDGAVNPIDGSAEYPATGAFDSTFDYYVGSDADAINAPSMPGYIGPANVCNFASGRPCTDTTAKLNIHFDLACTYGDAQLDLVYGRYGSEDDNLYLDGGFFAMVDAGAENNYEEFSFSMPVLGAGSHTITIEYAGGGSGNGHYIDFLTLDVTSGDCVGLDIKPGSYPNSFNVNGKGVIPVAILGSEHFDVTQIDVSTLDFAGLAVRVKGNDAPQCSIQDVSGANMPYGEPDGYDDLVCQFVDDATTWAPGSSEATLTGNLLDGTPFSLTDSINVVQ